MLICGCNNSPSSVQGNDKTESLTTTTTTFFSAATEDTVGSDSSLVEEMSPYPVVLNDVEITETPERVISTSPLLTEIIFEMGYGDKLVARSSYCDYPEEVSSISDLGSSSDPNIDMIIELAPDIVFTSTALASTDIFALNKEGIKVLHVSSPKSTDDIKTIYNLIGYAFEGLFDGKEKGENAYAVIESAVESIKNTGKTFIYITENLEVATNDTLEGSILGLFGNNAAGNAEGYAFDKEFLLEVSPDFVFLNSKYTAEDLNSDEILSSLDAVKNGNIILVDNAYFERPSARLAELIEQLVEETEAF